ncbi:uncharacterized protein [Blastocystis hominis]|uniref:Uncharacterized protein n=1 Tax=Blastocystis hominis TaxID=12968 RepID=D8LXU6_BLAHO|nr:uncharacterized protein [Blastocystis hominis]CBK20401.2 unnamed protein product [Blastocystis hominis]|eukprot:XP_012894449.1 uncharacterized protein [Blastocystis hominis]
MATDRSCISLRSRRALRTISSIGSSMRMVCPMISSIKRARRFWPNRRAIGFCLRRTCSSPRFARRAACCSRTRRISSIPERKDCSRNASR